MALTAATLASELEALTPTDTPGVAELRLAQAYGNYMHSALAGAVPIITAAVDATAVPAMAGAMTFTVGASAAQGAAVVRAGILAFWSAMVAAPATFFAGATLITPPTFPALASFLAIVFEAAAQARDATLEDVVDLLASGIHSGTAGQGAATFPGPVVSPIA